MELLADFVAGATESPVCSATDHSGHIRGAPKWGGVLPLNYYHPGEQTVTRKKVIGLENYVRKRRHKEATPSIPSDGSSFDIASGHMHERKSLFQTIHHDPDAVTLRRSIWEHAASEVLRVPVTLKQFHVRMLLKGVAEPDINLWWLYEWEKDGKVIELENGLFQLAKHMAPDGNKP